METIIIIGFLVWLVVQMGKASGTAGDSPRTPVDSSGAPPGRASPESRADVDEDDSLDDARELPGKPLEDRGDPDLMFDDDDNAYPDWEDDGDGPYLPD